MKNVTSLLESFTITQASLFRPTSSQRRFNEKKELYRVWLARNKPNANIVMLSGGHYADAQLREAEPNHLPPSCCLPPETVEASPGLAKRPYTRHPGTSHRSFACVSSAIAHFLDVNTRLTWSDGAFLRHSIQSA